MSDINFKLRGAYTFSVYPSALLGTTYNNVTVLSIMDPSSAGKEIDVQALHAQVFPTLPPGAPTKYDGYDYIKIQLSTGQVTILGIAWIVPSTITLITSSTITVTINNVSASDMPKILNALVQNGYNDVILSIN